MLYFLIQTFPFLGISTPKTDTQLEDHRKVVIEPIRA